MKKSYMAACLAAALMMVLGGTSAVSAQQVPIAGGYADAPSSDPEVVAAAGYAVRAQARRQGARISLVSIERAEAQVVAGLNYRLRLRVKVSGRPRDVTAVVYKNLRRRYSLTSWEVEDFGAKGRGADAVPAYTVEELAKALADAYESKSLGKLDASRPYVGRVKIDISHSLEDKIEARRFTTLAATERWLRSREIEGGLPARGVRPLLECVKGDCTYNYDDGILHNHLYLQGFSYGYRNGRPYIKLISLRDGH
ncbi:MAG TPA: cystatin domain-containing protein [Blastocatellia bacterium]|jgi:hypothetical protein|nr:cystatin domain-containing protein [Blastocatellia bacterium]